MAFIPPDGQNWYRYILKQKGRVLMIRDVEELRAQGYSDAEIAKILADGDATAEAGIAEELKKSNVDEINED